MLARRCWWLLKELVGIVYYSRISLFFCVDILLNSFFFAQRVQQITFVENLFEVFEVRSETWSRIPSRLCKIRCLDTQRKENLPPLGNSHSKKIFLLASGYLLSSHRACAHHTVGQYPQKMLSTKQPIMPQRTSFFILIMWRDCDYLF